MRLRKRRRRRAMTWVANDCQMTCNANSGEIFGFPRDRKIDSCREGESCETHISLLRRIRAIAYGDYGLFDLRQLLRRDTFDLSFDFRPGSNVEEILEREFLDGARVTS